MGRIINDVISIQRQRSAVSSTTKNRVHLIGAVAARSEMRCRFLLLYICSAWRRCFSFILHRKVLGRTARVDPAQAGKSRKDNIKVKGKAKQDDRLPRRRCSAAVHARFLGVSVQKHAPDILCRCCFYPTRLYISSTTRDAGLRHHPCPRRQSTAAAGPPSTHAGCRRHCRCRSHCAGRC